MTGSVPPSKRAKALELCNALLDDLDRDRPSTASAVQRLNRIATLVDDKRLKTQCRFELEGYIFGDYSREEFEDFVFQAVESGQIPADKTVEQRVGDDYIELPRYRRHYLLDEVEIGSRPANAKRPIAEYEEQLSAIRRKHFRVFIGTEDGARVTWDLTSLSKTVSGARSWVHTEATRLATILEFGEVPEAALAKTFRFVDDQLFLLIPEAANRLTVAYRNLSETNQENWENVVDTCRRVIKDFADSVFPATDELVHGMTVTDDKYLNRLRAYAKSHIESRRTKQHFEALLELVTELLVRNDNLASRSVHSGSVTRFEAERVLVYTYLTIGDLIILTGMGSRDDQAADRVNLNDASIDELTETLELGKSVAAEVLKVRRKGPFRSWDQVGAIKGIGPKTLDDIRRKASL